MGAAARAAAAAGAGAPGQGTPPPEPGPAPSATPGTSVLLSLGRGPRPQIFSTYGGQRHLTNQKTAKPQEKELGPRTDPDCVCAALRSRASLRQRLSELGVSEGGAEWQRDLTDCACAAKPKFSGGSR
ncbi:Hypothetical predicted protein [Marmota monax]|uniref:Uncharacterized protein n=1 Tax=Marmota monax TaxID=9995 RepID=A0A5E4C097_MARMO|nr:Hypothetical predicted protein [Marmota monax]